MTKTAVANHHQAQPLAEVITLTHLLPLEAKQTCRPCNGNGTVWVRRDGRNVETSCSNCNGLGEL